MSLLFSIVYAAHANGTHHKLALDALRFLQCANAEAWRRVFLKHAEIYLTGSKAPDTEFKDFKNHVLHVRDGFWGGAPEKAASWYTHLVDALRDRDFERAVYAAGVLSHYYTDPVHPFHTAQSEAENNVHRAVEWSINRSYNALWSIATANHLNDTVPLPAGGDWLKAHVMAAAERSNPFYETLITHYDIRRGVVEPTEGLDSISRNTVAGLLMYAAKGFAAILDRAFAEAAVSPPAVSLTAQTLLATLSIPIKWITKKIDDAETRSQVQAMYDELMSTGRVEAHLPDDDRQVRDLHRVEVLEPREKAREAERQHRLSAGAAAPAKTTRHASAKPAASAGSAQSGAATAHAPVNVAAATAAVPELTVPRTPIQTAPVTPLGASRDGLASLAVKPRVHLTLSDNLERAPSIGPKMAERFAAAGILTVSDFLSADADTCVAQLGDRRIDRDDILRWQQESKLVLRVPGLRGTHAQVLVGAGFATAEALADADPMDLSAALLAFATTPEGARILRSGDAPDVEAVTRWVRSAREALAA